MPVRRKPRPEEAPHTEPFTPQGLDATGDFREYFELKTYLPPDVAQAARKDATKTEIIGKEKKEELLQPVYWKLIAKAQLVGWRLLVPIDEPFDKERMFLERVGATEKELGENVAFWKYLDDVFDSFPEDVHLTIYDEIMRRGAFVATRSLITKGPDGRDVTFRRADAGVDDELVSRLSARKRDAVLPDAEPSVGVSGAGRERLEDAQSRVDKRPDGDAEGA